MKIDIRMTTLKSRLMLPFNKLTFPVSSLHINEKISVPWWQTTAEETWNFMTTFWDSESGQHQERGKEYSDCFLTRRLHCSCTGEGCYDWTVELTRSFFFLLKYNQSLKSLEKKTLLVDNLFTLQAWSIFYVCIHKAR